MGLNSILIEDTPDYVAFEADSAEEMFQKLSDYVANDLESSIVDFELKATGASPNFVATLTLGDDGTPVNLGSALFIVVGGVGGIDPVAIVEELQTQIRALGASQEINKVVMAGGGAGPHWMGAVIYRD
jgi:hypothetical protein